MTSRHLLFALVVGVGGCGSVEGGELYRELSRRSLPDGEQELLDAPATPGDAVAGPDAELGGEGSAPPDDDENADDDADGEEALPPPPLDAEPPTILWTQPSDGASAVRSGAAIVIQFSEAMARAATEAALTSDLGDEVAFSWSEGDTRLTLQPAAPLEYATGSEPLAARTYTVAFDGASDLAGNTLTGAPFTFSTLRRVTVELAPVLDRRLTGTVRADGLPPGVDCASVLCAGDESAAPGQPETQHKAFISFDLATLPPDLLEVLEARIDVRADDTLGEPFEGLGELHVERSDFRRIGSAAFSADPDATLGVLESDSEPVTSGDIRWLIQEDLAAGRYSQFRLCFPQVDDNDGSTDLVRLDARAQRLSIGYLVR
jgi:Big-like domain-containing protein